MQADRFMALQKAIAALPPGEFRFPAIYATDCNELSIGGKVKLGRELMNYVRKGYFAHVTYTGDKKGGERL